MIPDVPVVHDRIVRIADAQRDGADDGEFGHIVPLHPEVIAGGHPAAGIARLFPAGAERKEIQNLLPGNLRQFGAVLNRGGMLGGGEDVVDILPVGRDQFQFVIDEFAGIEELKCAGASASRTGLELGVETACEPDKINDSPYLWNRLALSPKTAV